MYKPFRATIIKQHIQVKPTYRVVTFVFALADHETIGATMLIDNCDIRNWERIFRLSVGDRVEVHLQNLARYRTPVVSSIKAWSTRPKHHHFSQHDLALMFKAGQAMDRAYSYAAH